MRRLLPARQSLPLHGVAATRAIEQRAAQALPTHTLMRRAGAAVARLAAAIAPHARRVWIAAGPGNNGGDGFEASLHLQARGCEVVVSLFADAARLPADAAAALSRASAAGVRIEAPPAAWLAGIETTDLAIDALLGIGATRAPTGAIADAIELLAELPCAVLAVDGPTGLDAGTGCVLGECAVRADHTLALLTAKPGLFTAAGRAQAGTVWLDALGVDEADDDLPTAWLAGIDRLAPWLRPRNHATHKGVYGDVLVVGGAAGMTGAALLAGRAAAMAGAGRVFVHLLDHAAPSHDALHPELMLRAALPAPAALADATVVCGCGGGDAVAAMLPRLLSTAARLVLDADALNAVAADAQLAALTTARGARGLATLLTPHPLEAARLLGVSTAEVQADRLAAAGTLAARYAATVLLKGSGSVIAGRGHAAWINGRGSAALATAGSGDVLAGALAGAWAEQAGDGVQAQDVAVATAVWHGIAAEDIAAGPLLAPALIERMAALRREPRP